MIRLEKYIKQIRGISYSPSDISEVPLEDYLPILKANNIQENTLDTSNLIYIHKSKIKNEQLIRKGDLLLAASSGSKDIVGKNVFFEEDFNGSFGAFCKVVRPLGNIYPKFLSAFFKTPNYKRHIRNLIQGANINNLRSEDIDSLKIPEFTHQGQIVIATILSKAENLTKQRKESIALLAEFLKSTFWEMFGDPYLNEKGWKQDQAGKAIKVKHGFAFKSEFFAEEGNFILLTPGNFYEEGGYKDRKEKQKYYKGEIPNDYILAEGDLLLAMTEQAEGLLGTPILVPESGKFLHNQRLGLIKYSASDFTNRFLFYFFNSKNVKDKIQQSATGTKVRHTSPAKIEDIPLIYPPIQLQINFTRIVEKVEKLKAHYQQSLLELENLYGSLSQLAFKGDLDISKISLSPFEVDGKPWPEPGGKGYGDPFEGMEGLPDDGRMFGAEEFKKLIDTGRWEDVTHKDLDEDLSSDEEAVANLPDEMIKLLHDDNEQVHETDITKMSLDDWYGISDEIRQQYGSIERHSFSWEFFLRKHFLNKSISAKEVKEVMEMPFGYFAEDSKDFKYDDFCEFVFKELKNADGFLCQVFNNNTNEIELRINEATKAKNRYEV